MPFDYLSHGCVLFGTFNHDNDNLSGENCAVSYKGAVTGNPFDWLEYSANLSENSKSYIVEVL